MDSSRTIVVVLLVALVILAVGFFASYSTSYRDVYHLSMVLRINLWNKYANGSRTVVLANNIGIPGGIVHSTRFMTYGISGYYPLTTRDFTGNIHVDSRAQINYTLGDFFEVWGEPLGPLNTLGYHQNVTSYSGNLTSVPPLFFWSMCVYPPGATTAHSVGDWGQHVLVNNETISLAYSTEACSLPGGQQ